jgi:tetratricopeptide (TPR) repeat protein
MQLRAPRLATRCIVLDRSDEAIAHYEKVLATSPAHAEARTSLGNTVHRLGRTQEAIEHFRRALAIDPSDPGIYSSLGGALVALGRSTEASEAFEKAIALAPRKAGFFWNLASVRHFSDDDRYFAAMQELAVNIDALDSEEQIDLYFALGKAFADIDNHKRSFEHLLRGNALKRQQVIYDEEKALLRLERISRVFTAEMLRSKAGLGDPSAAPIFIVGMPRSGTTLIEQILASHPKVFGAGELREMASLAGRISGLDTAAFPEAVQRLSGEELSRIGEQYAQAVTRLAPGAERITDKMPGNFSLAGLIHLALPNARIIHACRDARDTAFSCFSLLFSGALEFTYDLVELGRYYRAYLKVMHIGARCCRKGSCSRYSTKTSSTISRARRGASSRTAVWNGTTPVCPSITPSDRSAPQARPRCASRSITAQSDVGGCTKKSCSPCCAS